MNKINDSVVHQFLRMVEINPDNLALYVGGEEYSYRQLSTYSASIQQALMEEGYAKEQLIGLLTKDDIYTYASMIAILSLGAAYVPLNNKNPTQRNKEIILDTELSIVLSSVDHDQLNEASPKGMTILNTAQLEQGDELLEIGEFDSSKLAYILFTSGSTGKPKGVPISHSNLNAFMNVMLEPGSYDFSESDKFLQMFELTFDMSVSSYFLPLCFGASCIVMPQSGISYLNIVKIINEQKITVTQMVPSVILYLERFFNEINFASVRYSFFAGEALPSTIVPKWQQVIPNAKIINLYGPTETTIYCYRYDWSEQAHDEDFINGIIALGHPWPDTYACIVDNDSNVVNQKNRVGELCLSGDQVMHSYWQNPEKTKDSFIEIENTSHPGRYYRSGDLVSINSLGNTVYHGRADHQVKIDGHRVELGEVEHHIREITGSNIVVATLRQDPDTKKDILTAIIESPKKMDEDKILKEIGLFVPPYMTPKKVFTIDKMPINDNGKIDRKTLKNISFN